MTWFPPDTRDRLASAMALGATFGELRAELEEHIAGLRADGFGRPTITHDAAQDAARWPVTRWAATHARDLDLTDARDLRRARERWRRASRKVTVPPMRASGRPGD